MSQRAQAARSVWLRWRTALCTGLACVMLTACGAQVELLAQITESQANDVLGALMRQGVVAEKVPGKEGMVSVRVPQSDVARAIDIIQSDRKSVV